VFYTRKDLNYKDGYRQNPWVYHRKGYDHSSNSQSVAFKSAVQIIGKQWQALIPAEKDHWNRLATKMQGMRWTGFNLFVSRRL
jgi:hypothetical protein